MAYRDKEKQREYNRQKQQERRERLKAEKNAMPLPSPLDNPLDEKSGETEEPVVVVHATEPEPSLSLKERVLRKLQSATSGESPSSTRKRGKKNKEPNILTTTVPVVIASLVATYSQNLLPEEYKPCAPSREEVQAILSPLFNIVGRRLEVTGKMSPDAMDAIAALLASITYGTRAYILYTDIKKAKKEQQHGHQTGTAHERAGGNTQNATTRFVRYADSSSQYAAAPSSTEAYGQFGSERTDNGATEDRDREIALIADMFTRDKQGRVRLGLLRPELRESA
jgi:hypothetical protein